MRERLFYLFALLIVLKLPFVVYKSCDWFKRAQSNTSISRTLLERASARDMVDMNQQVQPMGASSDALCPHMEGSAVDLGDDGQEGTCNMPSLACAALTV
jgi:hypothetical protein